MKKTRLALECQWLQRDPPRMPVDSAGALSDCRGEIREDFEAGATLRGGVLCLAQGAADLSDEF
eukprot:2214083-Pyramimonas_sp.AAC.1